MQPDAVFHVRGSQFIDDLPEPPGLLHGAVAGSTMSCGRLEGVDTGRAAAAEGVLAVLTAEQLDGPNQIGSMVPDEPLLARDEVHYLGQPLALVVARTATQAWAAARQVEAEIVPSIPVFDPRRAAELGRLIVPPRTVSAGDVEKGFAQSDRVLSGTVTSGAQEHLYLETQAAMALPLDRGRIKLYSATQAPSAVQRTVAQVLQLPMHHVEVEVARLGGGFGGKEDQATPYAVMAAWAALHCLRPVKIVLPRQTDLQLTGKRHPYVTDYTIGISRAGRILALQLTFYQNSGAAADLSPAIMERSLFHGTSAYAIPHVRITGYSCRTNLPPFTAFRGFGAPQAVLAVEAAIDHAAHHLQLPREQLQRQNLLQEGDRLPFGMRVERCRARRCFDEVIGRSGFDELKREIESYNTVHPLTKKGLAITPICFGISFTNTLLNQAGALVHVYQDGSVSVNTGAVEMGQGVLGKICGIAARQLGIDRSLVHIEPTSTAKVANTSPTAASSGADLNGRATQLACDQIRSRLADVAARSLSCNASEIIFAGNGARQKGTEAQLPWTDLVRTAYSGRTNLTAQAHYATPRLHYDKTIEQGRPFAYHVYGAAVSQVTLDCLRGRYTIDKVWIVHDGGDSLDPLADLGQVEGGLLQGIGWLTCEEVVYDADGRLYTDSLSTYKVPDLHFAPRTEVHFLADASNPEVVFNSKGIGEPPFLYGSGSYFALLDAIRAFRRDARIAYRTPLTPEQVLLTLCEQVHS